MFDFKLERFNSIVEKRAAARLKLDRGLIKGHLSKRYEASGG